MSKNLWRSLGGKGFFVLGEVFQDEVLVDLKERIRHFYLPMDIAKFLANCFLKSPEF